MSKTESRMVAEARRIEQLKQAATPPVDASPEIIAAPAAGPRTVFRPVETVITENGSVVRYTAGRGFLPMRAQDAFDLTEEARQRADKSLAPLFNARQVNAGRAYSELYARVAAHGSPRSCLNVSVGGGQGGRSEAQAAERTRLEKMIAARGQEIAMAVKRRSGPDDKRRNVRLHTMVDLFCLACWPVDRILKSYGWPCNGRYRAALILKLMQALDRMADL